jgi:ATP-dependent DNA helicase 2 subunit 1
MPGLPYRPGDGAPNSHWTPPEDEDGEEEEELTDAAYKTAKDAVLFAIDVSKSMLTSPSESDPIRDSLQPSLR